MAFGEEKNISSCFYFSYCLFSLRPFFLFLACLLFWKTCKTHRTFDMHMHAHTCFFSCTQQRMQNNPRKKKKKTCSYQNAFYTKESSSFFWLGGCTTVFVFFLRLNWLVGTLRKLAVFVSSYSLLLYFPAFSSPPVCSPSLS